MNAEEAGRSAARGGHARSYQQHFLRYSVWLSKDYEFLSDTSESMIRVAMIHLMLKRLRPSSVT